MCHLSRVTCHVSPVTCRMSKKNYIKKIKNKKIYIYIYIFYLKEKLEELVELVGGGSVINGA